LAAGDVMVEFLGLWEIWVMRQKRTRKPPIHPGETLREDFLAPLGLSVSRLAIGLQVPVTRMNDIVGGKRAVTADRALRLARFFGTTPQFWMNLQANYELELAEDAKGAEIADRIRPFEGA
jgi:antitoxin HigA-1